MKRIYFLLVAIALVLGGCGNAFRVYHDVDTSADFDQYQTYTFLDWTDGNKKTITGIELERIRAQFAKELEAKGLTYVPEGGDLKVKVTVYFRNARDRHYGYYPGSYNYIERALAVDIFEGASKKHIWHSAAVGEVGRTPEVRAEDLPEQISEMFEKYPSGTE